MLPSEQRGDGDGEREDPDGEDDVPGPSLAQHGRVLQRSSHADVPVDADHAQAEDGGGAAEDVQGCPDVAQDLPERPVVEDLEAGREWDDDGADKQVCSRQVGDEVVRGAAQVRVDVDGQQDEHVSGDGRHGNQTENDSDEHDADRVHFRCRNGRRSTSDRFVVNGSEIASATGSEIDRRSNEVGHESAFPGRTRDCHRHQEIHARTDCFQITFRSE